MAEPRPQPLALLVVAAFSRHDEALAWGRRQLEAFLGSVALISPPFVFDQTAYYEPTMGADLRKQFFAFEELQNPDCLPSLKHRTNRLECELARSGLFTDARPLNLDPGLLTLGKFVLATTKDQAHRIYLRDGIFAEVTLRFQAGSFRPWEWTYADYRTPHTIAFLNQAREYYRRRLAVSEVR